MKTLINFFKNKGTEHHKPKSFWSTFKNAYIRKKNLKKFWQQLNKKNLPEDLVKITDTFISSESYDLISKFWKHCLINHFSYISKINDKIDPLKAILKSDYSSFTMLDEFSINKTLDKNYGLIDLKTEILKKHDDLTVSQSLQHNMVLLILYMNIKDKDIFKLYDKINKDMYLEYNPVLKIDNKNLTQQMLISLCEYEKIFSMMTNTSKKMNILEVGAGYGRTANMILSLKENVKYVIADLSPTIFFSYKLISKYFKDKKIKLCFEINSINEMENALNNYDILFIFPHQLKYFDKKIFDVTLSIGNLCEMEKKQIQYYMNEYERISKFLYFKVWEISGLPYSFNQYYSVHNKKDYEIKDSWIEHFKEPCSMPSNIYELGYEFK